MSLLIRHGLLMTMTEAGTYEGDVLIEDGRITCVAPEITDTGSATPCELEAKGLVIAPGFIDAHVCEPVETHEFLRHTALAAGVTTALVWPEHPDHCLLMQHDGYTDSRLTYIDLNGLTDSQLSGFMRLCAEKAVTPVCEVCQEKQCSRMLKTCAETGVKAILHLICGCEDILEDIAASGCAVIMGVSRQRTSSPWIIAAKLDAMGVPVAVTCSHPHAKLKYLPICAALCMRDGMPRERALHTITSTPASIFGLADAGQICIDARADLTIFDGDPLLLASTHIATIAGGRLLQT